MKTLKPAASRMSAMAAAVLALAAAASVAAPPAFAAEQQSHYALVTAALERHVLPAISAFRVKAGKLPEAVASVCASGDDAAREVLIAAFRETTLAWARIEFLRFGPLTEAGRRERISFWPDPRGVMNRQLRQVLASKDTKVIGGGAIAKQSAALQGLPALEVLIIDKDVPLAPGEATAFRCALAQAIAENIAAMAGDLQQSWTKAGGWTDKMLRPGSDNDTYKEPKEAASELVKALLVGLQLIGDGQVKPHIEATTPFVGPYAKSNLPALYYKAGVDSLEQFYEALSLESYLASDKDWVKTWAGGAWRTMKASNGSGGRGEGVAKGDEPPVRKVFGMITGLRKLVVGELSVAAGLTVGFNELDGD